MTRILRAFAASLVAAALVVVGVPAASFAAEHDADSYTIEVSADEYRALTAKVKMPDLVGLRADVAVDLLKGLELKWKFSKFVIIKKNWWVTKQGTKAGSMVAEGKKIKLTVSKKKPNASPATSPPDVPTTTGGLDALGGWFACEAAGEATYRYGFNLHYIVGVIAERLDTATDSWFLKADVTVTNVYGADYKTVAECTVTGSNSAPTVTSLFVYP